MIPFQACVSTSYVIDSGSDFWLCRYSDITLIYTPLGSFLVSRLVVSKLQGFGDARTSPDGVNILFGTATTVLFIEVSLL